MPLISRNESINVRLRKEDKLVKDVQHMQFRWPSTRIDDLIVASSRSTQKEFHTSIQRATYLVSETCSEATS